MKFSLKSEQASEWKCNMEDNRMLCRRLGAVFVVDVGSRGAFYLTLDEASGLAEALKAEVTYHEIARAVANGGHGNH